MSRQERKAAAAARRLEWRTRWSKLAREKFLTGRSIDLCARVVAEDAEKLARATPQLRSEIIRAANEFMTKLAAAVVAAGTVAYQKTHSNP